MESNSDVSSMVMYEDESVHVYYSDGAELQLSPCGCEFMLESSGGGGRHPPGRVHRVRQRTRFTTSAYKELIMAALAFRNNYASRPYLPAELVPALSKKPFFSLDSVVQWPQWSSCAVEIGHGGETIVRSEEGQAVLTLSPSGEEFSVEFTCRLSQPRRQRTSVQSWSSDCKPQRQQPPPDNDTCPRSSTDTEDPRRRRREKEPVRSRSCSPGGVPAQTKPEEMYQSTTVIQYHSCLAVPPSWHHPLSLARCHWANRLSVQGVLGVGTNPSSSPAGDENVPDKTSEERRSFLPQALPLSCPSPHWHSWRVKDPLSKNQHSEQEPPTKLVKVIWCPDVTYRTLSGAVAVVQVSLADGSVIRSNGVLNKYFTHHKPELRAAGVKKVTYHLNSLPPEVPGQLYSVGSIVRRASEILTCYNETAQSLALFVAPSCLQEGRIFSMDSENVSSPAPAEQHFSDTQTQESLSDLVAEELAKIKQFNSRLENSPFLGDEKESEANHSAAVSEEPVSDSCIAEALQRTSKAIDDIDALISAATLT